MIWYVVFALLRLLITVFFFLTATYSILNYSPFVFNQFIRPRIFGWVNEFVAWHHLWYLGAYLLCVITLIPDLRRGPRSSGLAEAGPHVLARRLAIAFVVVFGLVAEWLMLRGRSGGVHVWSDWGHFRGPGSFWVMDAPPSPDRFIRLTFGPDGKLAAWRRVVK